MANTKSFKIYHNGDAYDSVRLGNEVFNIKSDTFDVDIITVANEALVNINSMTITTIEHDYGSLGPPPAGPDHDIVVTFTPITDTAILNAVTAGTIKVRLQLLFHADSFYIWNKMSSKHNHHGTDYGLQPPTSRTDAERWQVAVDYGHTDDWSDPGRNYWFRVHSHTANKNGITWLDLTAAQLQAGSAKLQLVEQAVSRKRRNLTTTVYAPREGKSSFQGSTTAGLAYGDIRYYDYAALLYIPALGPGTSHPFDYHDQGYYRASDDAVKIRICKTGVS